MRETWASVLRDLRRFPRPQDEIEMQRLRDALNAEQAMRTGAESALATALAELARVQEERDGLKKTVDHWAGIIAAHTCSAPPVTPRLTTAPGWGQVANHIHDCARSEP